MPTYNTPIMSHRLSVNLEINDDNKPEYYIGIAKFRSMSYVYLGVMLSVQEGDRIKRRNLILNTVVRNLKNQMTSTAVLQTLLEEINDHDKKFGLEVKPFTAKHFPYMAFEISPEQFQALNKELSFLSHSRFPYLMHGLVKRKVLRQLSNGEFIEETQSIREYWENFGYRYISKSKGVTTLQYELDLGSDIKKELEETPILTSTIEAGRNYIGRGCFDTTIVRTIQGDTCRHFSKRLVANTLGIEKIQDDKGYQLTSSIKAKHIPVSSWSLTPPMCQATLHGGEIVGEDYFIFPIPPAKENFKCPDGTFDAFRYNAASTLYEQLKRIPKIKHAKTQAKFDAVKQLYKSIYPQNDAKTFESVFKAIQGWKSMNCHDAAYAYRDQGNFDGCFSLFSCFKGKSTVEKTVEQLQQRAADRDGASKDSVSTRSDEKGHSRKKFQ